MNFSFDIVVIFDIGLLRYRSLLRYQSIFQYRSASISKSETSISKFCEIRDFDIEVNRLRYQSPISSPISKSKKSASISKFCDPYIRIYVYRNPCFDIEMHDFDIEAWQGSRCQAWYHHMSDSESGLLHQQTQVILCQIFFPLSIIPSVGWGIPNSHNSPNHFPN